MALKNAAGKSPAVLHREAMEKADKGIAARGFGDETTARPLFMEAFRLEREALSLVPSGSMTYFVLSRSAAVLALDGGLPHDAEALATSALSETPPAWLAKELRDVLRSAREE
jgi:hypothetical protein